MHALELRETRFRLQQAIAKLEDGSDKAALEQQVADLQAVCEHLHSDEDPDKGWRCRDCDLTRDPEPVAAPVADGEAGEAAAATTD